MTASVSFVSSTLDSLIGCGARKQTRTQSRFFRSETLTLNSCRSLHYARGNESVIYFTNPCKPKEADIYARKKHPFVSYPAAKHPNASNLQLQTYEKNQWTLFNNTARASSLSSRNNFQNLGSFAKVSVPVKNYNFLNVHIHTYKCIYIYSMCIYVI